MTCASCWSVFRCITALDFCSAHWSAAADPLYTSGYDVITFRDPGTFEVLGQISVRDDGIPIDQLNELEFVRGEIYANVWKTNRIVRISPETGAVLGWIELGHLADRQSNPNRDVLNGIAWDDAEDRLFVTGKLWSELYEIELAP